MLKAYKYRIYPNKAQEELINKTFGCVRFIYNWALEKKIKLYETKNEKISCFELMNEMTELKNDTNYEWLKEVNAQALQQSLRHLDSAFTFFFRQRTKFPKFKSKHSSRKSFTNPQSNKIDFKNKKVRVQKLGWLKAKIDREFTGKLKKVIVSQVPSGKYYVSVLVEDKEATPPKPKINKDNTIGIDLGIKDFITVSNGKKVKNPKYLRKKIKSLRLSQKRLSRKKKRSNNWKKQKRRLARKHEKVVNCRNDFLHKLSTKLISENQTICLETLDITEMLKNPRMAKYISDAGWHKFVEFLEYKSDWYGVNILKIGQFEPSSKICSVCGTIKSDLKLSDREWTCSNCSTKHDRDVNAAKNIKNFALQKQGLVYNNTAGAAGINACGEESLDTRGNKKKPNNCIKTEGFLTN